MPDCRRPLMIGHRGTINYRPENTMSAYLYALESGGDGIEIDLRLSADQVLVAMHDATIDRTTNGNGPVASHTLAELQALDAGSWFGEDYSQQFVPSFADIVEGVDAYEETYMLDIRDAEVLDAAIEEVQFRGLSDRTLFALWDIELIEEVCSRDPTARAIFFIYSMDAIPAQTPACLEIIRYRGAGSNGEAINQEIRERGFESMVGGWSVDWGTTRYGIADSLHAQMPWLEEQEPAECRE